MMTKILPIVCMGALFLSATQPSIAEPCVNFDAARNKAYVLYIRGVLDEIKAIQEKRLGDPAFNAALTELGNEYLRRARVGDVSAYRKLIGIGLFGALAAHTQPLETTFKLTCEAAKGKLEPVNVLDPLTCAVIAVDGSRRGDPANRRLANEMIEIARTNLAVDKNGQGAQEVFDSISQAVVSCLSPP